MDHRLRGLVVGCLLSILRMCAEWWGILLSVNTPPSAFISLCMLVSLHAVHPPSVVDCYCLVLFTRLVIRGQVSFLLPGLVSVLGGSVYLHFGGKAFSALLPPLSSFLGIQTALYKRLVLVRNFLPLSHGSRPLLGLNVGPWAQDSYQHSVSLWLTSSMMMAWSSQLMNQY